jgi:hypothetical protein
MVLSLKGCGENWPKLSSGPNADDPEDSCHDLGSRQREFQRSEKETDKQSGSERSKSNQHGAILTQTK